MTTTEYKTDAMVLSTHLMLVPFEKFVVTLGGNYTKSTAEFDPVIMPAVSDEIHDQLHTSIFDYSNIHTYSDISSTYLTGKVNMNYAFSAKLSWLGEVIYSKYTDDNGYVYGDETGDLMILRTGLQYGF